MRSITTQELLTEQIDFRDICVFPVREPLGLRNIFRNKMRHCSVLFLYISGCREYQLENGTCFALKPGEILYVPQYSTYSFRITDTQGAPTDYAIAIDFEMVDAEGRQVSYGDTPRVLLQEAMPHYLSRFQRALALYTKEKFGTMPLKSEVYSIFYEILCQVHLRESVDVPWKEILPAIERIESAPAENTPIPELARRCGISETRFRQLFLQYTGGLSPVRYRNRLRIAQVERLLRTEQVTVEYAASYAGFRDMSHFYRIYKQFRTNESGGQ